MSDGCSTPYRQLGYGVANTSLDVFSLRREHGWTCSVSGDRICDMKRVTESGQQGIKT